LVISKGAVNCQCGSQCTLANLTMVFSSSLSQWIFQITGYFSAA
jgi:DNA-binding transcriptional regulator YdaS (Cro superfamily)